MNSNVWIDSLTVGPIATNCYVIGNSGNGEAYLVDPGDESERILAYLRERKLTLKGILLTHGHFDHVLAVNDLKAAFPKAQVMIGGLERDMVEDNRLNSGFGGYEYYYEVDRYLEGGDILSLFGLDCYVLETPGHTRGSVCYYLATTGTLFAGDTIFRESHGRCDLPTGDPSAMEETLYQLLTTLPEEVRILPGHGPSTTVSHERDINDLW